MSPDSSKIEKVATWQQPITTKHVQQILRFAGYYRRLITDFTKITRPLNHLTEQGRKFLWTEECSSSFEMLRHKLTTAPLLAYPDFSKPFIFDTDASDTGIRTALSQLGEGGEKQVVACASRTLSKPERGYCVI